jgi:hypothetical protein
MSIYQYTSKESQDLYDNAEFSKLISLKACESQESLDNTGIDYFIDQNNKNRYFTYTENSNVKYIKSQLLKDKIDDKYTDSTDCIESQFWLKPGRIHLFKTGVSVSKVDKPIRIFNANKDIYSKGITILGGIVLIYSDQEIQLTLINLSDKIIKIPVGQEIACLLDDFNL